MTLTIHGCTEIDSEAMVWLEMYNFRLQRQRLAFFLSAVGNRCHRISAKLFDLWPCFKLLLLSIACVYQYNKTDCEAALDFSLATIPWAYSACIRKTACETYTNFARLMENPWESTCPQQSVSRDAAFLLISRYIPFLRVFTDSQITYRTQVAWMNLSAMSN